MAVSRRSIPAMSAAFGGMVVLAALTMSPAVAGSGGAAASAGSGCTATAHVETQWGSGAGGGQIVVVTVTNASAAITPRWAVTWTPGTGRRVVSAWNAAVSTSGGTATAVNASYDGILAPGASTTFGMQLSGTGSAPALSCDNGTATPPSSGSPGSGPATVTVSAADNQQAVALRVGDTLVVSLASNYLPPKLSVSGVLEQGDTTGGYPTGQPLVARYAAVAAGTVGVSTRTDIACNHEPTPCPSPQVPWAVTVTVAA
jgi:hypothetical protein